MTSMRVVLKWSGGFILDRASDEERERGRKAAMAAVWEKWKKDPTTGSAQQDIHYPDPPATAAYVSRCHRSAAFSAHAKVSVPCAPFGSDMAGMLLVNSPLHAIRK